jgi:hypothetical protein
MLPRELPLPRIWKITLSAFQRFDFFEDTQLHRWE